MSNLSQIKADSNWGDASNTINTNFQNMDVELEKLKNSTTRFKGYFTSESNLKNKFPSPKRGDIAFVGEPYPGNVYDVLTDGSWHNTTKAPETGSVDLQDYVTQDDFEASQKEQDDKLTKLKNEIGFTPVEWKGTVSETRNSIDNNLRHNGIVLLYNDGTNNIADVYINENTTSANWGKEVNWMSILFTKDSYNAFVNYSNNKEETRLLIPRVYRKKGFTITYYDKYEVRQEIYIGVDSIEDVAWKDNRYWIDLGSWGSIRNLHRYVINHENLAIGFYNGTTIQNSTSFVCGKFKLLENRKCTIYTNSNMNVYGISEEGNQTLIPNANTNNLGIKIVEVDSTEYKFIGISWNKNEDYNYVIYGDVDLSEYALTPVVKKLNNNIIKTDDILSQLNKGLIESQNSEVEHSYTLTGYYDRNNGTIIENSSWKSTDKIDIPARNYVYFEHQQYNSEKNIYVVFFSKEGAFTGGYLSQISNKGEDKILIKIPENSKKIAWSVKKSESVKPSATILNIIDLINFNISEEAIKEAVNESIIKLGLSNRLSGITLVAMGNSITRGEGTERTYHDIVAKRNGFISINKGESGTSLARFDSRGRMYSIKDSSESRVLLLGEFQFDAEKVEEDIFKIRASSNGYMYLTVKYNGGTFNYDTDKNIIFDNTSALEIRENSLEGEILDIKSYITDGGYIDNYGNVVEKEECKYLKMSVSANTDYYIKFPNSVIQYSAGIRSFVNRIDETLKSFNDVSGELYMTVFGGTNDNNYQLPVGDIESDSLYDFYGALKYLLSKIINYNPLIHLGLITPLNRDNGNPKKYRDAILEVAEMYSLPVLDLYSISGIPYVSDCREAIVSANIIGSSYLHPGTIGHERIANKYEEFLKML